MIVGLVSMALAAPDPACPERWPAAALAEAVAQADASAARMDPVAFTAARDGLLARLACVQDPLTGPQIGAVHRVVATAAFLEDESGRVAPALAGLAAADPGYQLPLEIFPEGHPLRTRLREASLLARDGGARPLATLSAGWLEVDGLSATSAPTTRAAVIQAFDAQGGVVETRYVWPDEDLGPWAGAPPPAPATARPRPARVALAVATVASVVTTGVLYGLARADYDAFLDEGTARSDAELLALRSRANGLTIGWVGAGVASAGLAVGLAVAW